MYILGNILNNTSYNTEVVNLLNGILNVGVQLPLNSECKTERYNIIDL
jgi:hypothetical protein